MPKVAQANKLSDVKLTYLRKFLHGDSILDVGAGYGYYSEWISKNYPAAHVVALDQLQLPSPQEFEYLSTDLESAIPLPNNSFQTVVAFDIIEHINHEQPLLHELMRICKPGGHIIGSVPHDDDKFLPAYNLTFYHRSDVTNKRYYTPATLTQALEGAGFSLVTIDKQGVVSPQIIAEFFPHGSRWLIKKLIGLMRRTGIVNAKRLSSDLFFVARKG